MYNPPVGMGPLNLKGERHVSLCDPRFLGLCTCIYRWFFSCILTCIHVYNHDSCRVGSCSTDLCLLYVNIIFINSLRDISCCYGDRDLVTVCHGAVEDGQYVRHASLLRLEGGDPDETDQGTLKPLGEFLSPNAIQRSLKNFTCKIMFYRILYSFFTVDPHGTPEGLSSRLLQWTTSPFCRYGLLKKGLTLRR